MFGLLVTSGSPESPTPIEPFLPFAWPRKKRQRQPQLPREQKTTAGFGFRFRCCKVDGIGMDAMAARCLPAQLAGLATGVITDQSVCGHVQREEVSEKGWSSKAQGMDARGKQGVQPKFSFS